MNNKIQIEGFMKVINEIRAKQVLKYCKGSSCLEIGAGYGQITKHLVKKFDEVEAIEPDKKAYDSIKLAKNLTKIRAPFGMPLFNRKFDTIVCTNVLEHIDDIDDFIASIKEVSHKDTVIFISVPNAASINRLIGVDTKMLRTVYDLGPQDKIAGHKRMYDLSTLIIALGDEFNIIKSGSFICKPLPNADMIKLPKSLIKKYLNMNVRNYGAEIFCVCKIYG